MTAPRPSPSQVPASGEGWTVTVNMPVFEKGRKRGKTVGWLNLNTLGKLHWRERDEIVRLWRQASYLALYAKRLPKGLGRVRVQIELRCVDNRVRDVPNYEPTFKPVIDALQPTKVKTYIDNKGKLRTATELGVGLIPGDDARYLERTAFEGPTLGRTHKSKGQVILHITPLPEEAA